MCFSTPRRGTRVNRENKDAPPAFIRGAPPPTACSGFSDFVGIITSLTDGCDCISPDATWLT